jgi:hypothetical protein
MYTNITEGKHLLLQPAMKCQDFVKVYKLEYFARKILKVMMGMIFSSRVYVPSDLPGKNK